MKRWNTPIIETERLILRQFTLKDAPAFLNFMKDEQVNRFLPFWPLQTRAEAEQYLQENYIDTYTNEIGFNYAICLKTNNVPIGYIHMSNDDSYDFGYGLQQSYWQQGIITEASHAVIKQIAAAGIPYITATHDIQNPKSGNVMQKLGMTYCYSYQEQWQPKDILVTFRMYQLNFDDLSTAVYQKYWNQYPHFIEEGLL